MTYLTGERPEARPDNAPGSSSTPARASTNACCSNPSTNAGLWERMTGDAGQGAGVTGKSTDIESVNGRSCRVVVTEPVTVTDAGASAATFTDT